MNYTVQTHSSAVRIAPNNSFRASVHVAVPEDYTPEKNYPVVLVGKGLNASFDSLLTKSENIFYQFLHGFGITDTEQEFVFVHVDRNSTCWIEQSLYALADVKNDLDYNIDPSSVFVIGHSAGGGFAMSAYLGKAGTEWSEAEILENAKRIKAIVAQAPNQDTREDFDIVEELIVPTWIVVGEDDEAAYTERAERLHEGIIQNGGDSELLVRPNKGHGAWQDVYTGIVKMEDGRSMWPWFADQLQEKPPVELISEYKVSFYSNDTIKKEKLSGEDVDFTVIKNETELKTNADGTVTLTFWARIRKRFRLRAENA